MGAMVTLRVRVIPNAPRNEVVGLYGKMIKIKVHAPAMDGKANAALLEYVAEKLGLPERQVTLEQGEKSREKLIGIEGLDLKTVRSRLLGKVE